MQEEIELVATHCKHPDCIYRSVMYFDGKTPICVYAMIENEVRGCKISECNKYKKGTKTKARMREDVVIFWETELYGNTDDNSVL